jgi:hypothetical protein
MTAAKKPAKQPAPEPEEPAPPVETAPPPAVGPSTPWEW